MDATDWPNGKVSAAGVLNFAFGSRRHASLLSAAKDQDGCWALRAYEESQQRANHSPNSASSCPQILRLRSGSATPTCLTSKPGCTTPPDESTGGFLPNGYRQPPGATCFPNKPNSSPVGRTECWASLDTIQPNIQTCWYVTSWRPVIVLIGT